MLFIGLIAKKKDVQSIKKDIKEKEIEIIEIKENNIENLKNIKFEEIIFLDDINLKENEYIKVLYNWGEIYRYLEEMQGK